MTNQTRIAPGGNRELSMFPSLLQVSWGKATPREPQLPVYNIKGPPLIMNEVCVQHGGHTAKRHTEAS